MKFLTLDPIRDVWVNRHLVKALAVSSEKSSFNHLALGLAWRYLEPLFHIATYYIFIVLVRGHGASNSSDTFLIILTGLMVYEWVRRLIIDSSRIFAVWKPLILTVNGPIVLFIGVGICQNSFAVFPLWIISIIGVGIIHGFDISMMYLPFIVALIAICVIPICVLIAYVGSYFTDLHRILEMVFRIMLFVSPVLWSMDTVPEKYKLIMAFNPLAVCIGLVRSLLLKGSLPSLEYTALLLLISLLFIVMALWVLKNVGRKVVKVL